jgi:hypothetical protein
VVVVHAPTAAEVPGVEEHFARTNPDGSRQPRAASIATGDREFRRDLLIAIVAFSGIAQ